MGRLRDVMVGTRAIKRVRLPLVNVPGVALPDQPELAAQRDADRAALKASSPPGSVSGAFGISISQVEAGVRVLTGAESSLILEKASAFSKAHGGTGEFSDPQHGLGMQIYTLALAYVDPDSDPRSPIPFFGEIGDHSLESAAKEILESPHLGRDGILYLYESQELWQDMCSPQAREVGVEKLLELMTEATVEGDPRGFLALRPATRWSCFRSISALHLSSLMDKSQPGPSSQASSFASAPGKGAEA